MVILGGKIGGIRMFSLWALQNIPSKLERKTEHKRGLRELCVRPKSSMSNCIIQMILFFFFNQIGV